MIAIGGAYGTLSEIGHALSDGKPIFALNSWEITKRGIQDPLLTHCKNEKEAVVKALAYASGG